MERLQKKLERICMLTAIVVSVILVASAFAHAELTKIADNVYSYVDVKNSSPTNSFAANAGIVIGRDAILVVDTLISAKEAQRFIKDIRKISDKPIRYVVNTHYHLDHSLGNCEFARQGAIIISQTNDRKNLEKKGAEELKSARSYGLSEEEMAGTVVTLPSVTFSDRMTIDLGSETVELIFIASSHTDGSALVYLPLRKVLFAGDILFTDFHPFMGDGDIAGWVETLDYMLFLDADKIIPGHGPISGKRDVADMKAYIQLFDNKARELVAKSKDLDYITAELKKVLPVKSQGEWLIPYNLKIKYLPAK
ncbi:MAG TPA: MBL fold metallo-hydrolase [Geobacteraceae bacterium]|nr:MBL fold metallo-hydrolase [Geobacteraceae bacterium]